MRALVYKLITFGDENSDQLCISILNSSLNLIAHCFTEGESHAVRINRETIKEYMWMMNEVCLQMVLTRFNAGTRVS